MMSKKDILSSVDFGHRVAEDEGDALAAYFVETDNWRKLYDGEIDVIYGPKGSGKSALYFLLLEHTDSLFDRYIILTPAEKPRGTPVFRDLVADPPASEAEFVNLWKLYLLSIVTKEIVDMGITGYEVDKIRKALADEGLSNERMTLSSIVGSAYEYVKRALRPGAIEGGVNIDPITQMPTGFSGKISFREPTDEARAAGMESVDRLLFLTNLALQKSTFHVWVLLDRLDVAFADSPELEQNALRALFKVYLDLSDLQYFHTKIFLRTDIWDRITKSGFREASHITKHVTISWNRTSLLNLIVRRALHNELICSYYKAEPTKILDATQEQEEMFFRIFPRQVDVGPNKPTSLDWLLSRTRDGTQRNAPREIIHFLNALRSEQMRRFEIGEPEPDEEALFARATFKDALPEVSEVRLTQTLYAENPELRESIEKLRGEKTLHNVQTLQRVWGVDEANARLTADSLVEAAFFERRGTKQEPEYWVPFLYRDALGMTQGTAE